MLNAIDVALASIMLFVSTSKVHTIESKPISVLVKALSALRVEIEFRSNEINSRVLRGMRDAGGIVARELDATPIEAPVSKVCEILYQEIPDWIDLEPLRSDFGKGDPI